MRKIGIILAGGKGKRMANFASPKVMLKVRNITLVENHIQGFLNVLKVDLVVLVINSAKSELLEHSKELISKYGEKLVVIEGAGSLKNATKYGIDLLHAFKNFNDGDLYIYVMGDHFIDYDDLKHLGNRIELRIREFYEKTREKMLIFIDSKGKYARSESQSKTLIEGNIIVRHGKRIKDWNALEVGLMIVKREVLTALKLEENQLGDFDTTDIIDVTLTKLNGIVTYFDVKGICWFGVNTFDDWMYCINNYIKYKLTVSETVKICKEGCAGIFAHAFYKYIAAFITFLILKLRSKTRAESVAFITYILAIPSAVVAYFHPFLGAIIYLFLEILDSVDGTIARLKNTCNTGGGLIDSGAGALRHTLIPLAIFIHYKLYMPALGIAILQALKYRLRWHITEVGVHVKGIAARVSKRLRSKVQIGLTGDVMVTLILGALILDYSNIAFKVPIFPFTLSTGIHVLFIELVAHFLFGSYIILSLLDVFRLPKIAFRIYKEYIKKVKSENLI